MPPFPPRLNAWLADCDAWEPALLLPALSIDEQARAARFLHDRDRERFVVRRALLRRLLGERLGLPAADVPLVTGDAGKPLLAAPPGHRGALPGFNLARSGGLVLVAFREAGSDRNDDPARAEPDAEQEHLAVGVDIERIDGGARTVADLRRVATHFAAEESGILEALQGAEAAVAFYRYWTGKEACLKCLGSGIGGRPTLADVVIDFHQDGSVGGATWRGGARSWRIRSLTPAPGHVAAIAIPAAGAEMGHDTGPDTDPDVVLHRLEPAAAERRVSRVAAPPPGHAPGAP